MKPASLSRFAALVMSICVLSLVSLAGPPQRSNTLKGTATYREKIALPPNASFEATLEDVSRADVPAEEIGKVRIENAGQPPFRFTIPYDPVRIRTSGSYSVRARVLVGGKPMFTTVQAEPVLTRGRGTTALLIMDRATVGFEGMFRYMADAATFTDCETGQRYAVAMDAGYKSLESAYLKVRREPGEELKVTFSGQVDSRPGPDKNTPSPTVVVERYRGAWQGESCGTPGTSSPLQETYWKLTRLQGSPILLAEGQREPNLTFRTEQNKVSGFTGCNNLVGSYRLNGGDITLSGIAVTRMACAKGMDIEVGLFPVLGKVRKWKITGHHLDLYDAEGVSLARFEARPPK